MARALAVFLAALAALAARVDGYAGTMASQCARLTNCASGSCAAIMSKVPIFTAGLLEADGLTDGGTYSPGATITIGLGSAYTSGEYVLYATAGSLGGFYCGGKSLANSAGSLTLGFEPHCE